MGWLEVLNELVSKAAHFEKCLDWIICADAIGVKIVGVLSVVDNHHMVGCVEDGNLEAVMGIKRQCSIKNWGDMDVDRAEFEVLYTNDGEPRDWTLELENYGTVDEGIVYFVGEVEAI